MRRIVFYLFHDSKGVVADYIPFKLAALREHAEHIFVVSNSQLDADNRAKLEAVADTVWERENVGFDVWAYKEAMLRYGWDNLTEYDELVLMNYTFFAPIFPFAEMFDRMDAIELDFWGPTAHKAVDPHPFPGQTGVLPFHIQSHWISVRKQMFTSYEFQQYWETMPMITSYDGSIVNHESRFTKHFADKEFHYTIAFPPEKYPTDHPVFQSALQMLDDRCPLLKRRMFFHEPTYLDAEAILGRKIIEKVECESDYPVELIWSNVVRSSEPRTLYTNFSMLEVVNEIEIGEPRQWKPRIAVLAHMYYEDMVDEVMESVAHVPAPYDLIVTTVSEEKKQVIEQSLAAYDIAHVDVRVMAQNRGRDMAALFITCRDVLLDGNYDLICRIHSKKSPQNSVNAAEYFKEHMFSNLLYSDGYVENVIKLFEREKTLGMTFPPVVAIAYPTLGHSWFTNRQLAWELSEKLGINTPFDRTTPLAAYGTMFWFRPEAIQKLAAHDWRHDDYPPEPGHNDGGLAHVQERLLAYATLDAGYHVRAILTRESAATIYPFLEYRMQRLTSLMSAYSPQAQFDYIENLQRPPAPLIRQFKDEVDANYPALAKVMRPGYKVARLGYRAARKVTRAALRR